MDPKFTERIKKILSYSKEEAIRLGNRYIGTEHIFLGILREGEADVLDELIKLGVDLREVKEAIEERVQIDGAELIDDSYDTGLLKETERALKLTQLEAISFKQSVPDTEHLVLAILKDSSSIVTQVLNEREVTYELLKDRLIESSQS
ncbi:MAG: hypothetical protein HC831_07890 [Chloroflexia bacterium]|nr:hypothetical protein [Chloroflexia bacterium]